MLKLMACSCVLIVLSAPLAIASTVTVGSGNGNVGNRDSSVTFLVGPETTDFNTAFTQSDFSSAQSGQGAFILDRNPLWVSGLSVDPAAKWVGTNPTSSSQGNSALYAVSFTIPSAFSSATLTLNYAVDDWLGLSEQGLYLNGHAVCGNLIANVPTNFSQEHVLTCTAIDSLLQVGTNWMYFDAANGLGPAGLLFSATITTTGTPEPATFGLIGCALVGLWCFRLRKPPSEI